MEPSTDAPRQALQKPPILHSVLERGVAYKGSKNCLGDLRKSPGVSATSLPTCRREDRTPYFLRRVFGEPPSIVILSLA